MKDADQAARAIDKLAFSLDPADRFWDIFSDEAEMKKRRLARVPRIEPLPAPDRGYRLILPPHTVSSDSLRLVQARSLFQSGLAIPTV